MAERVLTRTEVVLRQQERQRYLFGIQVVVWWIIILGLLVFIFSGITFSLGPITIKTINLDTEFMKTWAPYISRGVPVTIFIALVSDFLLTPALLSIVYGKKVQAIERLEVSV